MTGCRDITECSFLYFCLGSISPSLWSAGAFTSPSTLIDSHAFKVPTVITRHCARRPYRPEYPGQNLPQKSWKIGDVKLAFVVLLVRYFCSCNDSCWNGESKINSVFGYMESPANFHHRIVRGLNTHLAVKPSCISTIRLDVWHGFFFANVTHAYMIDVWPSKKLISNFFHLSSALKSTQKSFLSKSWVVP